MYQPQQLSRSTFVPIRQLRYHVREWGEVQANTTPLVLLHGWMDVGASWQFVVDGLRQRRWTVAPDWRGFGQTRGAVAAVNDPLAQPDSFCFADYLGDLDALLDHFAGDQPVDLVGHSMGGNVAMAYSGVRPGRVRRVVNLEGFGLPETRPAQAPERYAQWLNQIKLLRQGELNLKTYASREAVARRLMKTNSRLPEDKAQWLAGEWAAPNSQGAWAIQGEPGHKVVSAQLYQVPEALALYQRISAPVLSVTASDDSLAQLWKDRYTPAQYQARLGHVPNIRSAVIANAGHMLHHDQPQALAELMEDFFRQ